MINSIDAFIKFFEGINRRTIRDVSALPAQSQGWKPSAGEGEQSWDVGQIVAHLCMSRRFFVGAYSHGGWHYEPWSDMPPHSEWIELIEKSAEEVRSGLRSTPNEWLARKVQSLDSEISLSGWRILMMMVEHEIHHRSQLDTYAGINGWKVEQIFDRSFEQVAESGRNKAKS